VSRLVTRRAFVRGVAIGLGLAPAALALDAIAPSAVHASTRVKTKAHDQGRALDGQNLYELPFAASHVAVHWDGAPDAAVAVSFSGDGQSFSAPAPVEKDDVGESRGNGETFGAVMLAGGATAVRVTADRRLKRLNVLAMVDGERTVTYTIERGAAAAYPQPAVITRAGWGCDESLRTWEPEFYPLQKLICHHTAGANNDPNPPATIRSIYYYHAVTQGWGDIGYNFLIDEAGRIYEGRYSRPYESGEYPTGENTSARGVTAAHAYQFNSGTCGIALLGTFTGRDATPQARAGLEEMLAWKADRHGIDPLGSAVYTNPVTLASSTFANIAGHRDVTATQCPGGAFYKTLPIIRRDVATKLGAPAPTPTPTRTRKPTRNNP
jgi:N-acetylmuramoyl-L-alanine amidase-like protein